MDVFESEGESVHSDKEPELKRDKAWIMEQITKDKFEGYYMTWKSGMTEEVPRISPYDF